MTTELTQCPDCGKPSNNGRTCRLCDSEDALHKALTQRPAAQTEREADGYGSTDLPWSFTVCRELEPQEKRLMSMLVSAFGSDHPAIDDMAHLILNRPASLPAPQQATPERHLTVTTTPQGEAVMVSWQDDEHRILEVVWERKQATPEPVRPNLPVAGYSNARGQEEPLVYLNDVLAQQATPEPEGEVYGWAVTGLSFIWRGEHAQACAEQEAKTCGGTSTAFPLFTRPAPGVPEADPLQGAVDWFWQAIPNLKAHDVANRLSIGCNRAARLLAAAQAKGAGHE